MGTDSNFQTCPVMAQDGYSGMYSCLILEVIGLIWISPQVTASTGPMVRPIFQH